MAEAWSVEALEAEIARSLPTRPADAPRVGRPPLPLQVKRFAKVEPALQTQRDDAEGDGELDAETTRELLGRAEIAQAALVAWIGELRLRLGE